MLILVGVGVTAAAALLVVIARSISTRSGAAKHSGDDIGVQLVCVAVTGLIAIGAAVLVSIAADGGGGAALVETVVAGAIMLALLAFAFTWRIPGPPERR